MGGPGSGRGFRWDTRSTLDALGRLDVRWLHRHGYLDGEPHWWPWFQGRRLHTIVELTLVDVRLVVDAGAFAGPGTRKPLRSTIALAWTPCHYGGQRPWFRCPACSRRVAVLWGEPTRVWCRHCTQVPYASQCATAEDRRYRKVWKLRDRLGASHNFTEPIRPSRKPKGMHWRTWERLRAQEEQAHWLVLADLEGALARLRRGL